MEDISNQLLILRSAETIVRHESLRIAKENALRRCSEIGKLMLIGLAASGAAFTGLSFVSYRRFSDFYQQ